MKAVNLLLLFCLIPLAGFAQVDKDPIKTQIREIKLGEKHVYGEATSNLGIPEAKQISLDELHANVIGLFSEAGKTKEEAEQLWNTNVTQCKFIVSQNEDLFQSFVYIPKSLLLLKEATATTTPVAVADTTAVSTKTDSLATPAVAEVTKENIPVATPAAETNVTTTVTTAAPAVAAATTSSSLPSEKEFTMDDKTAALILKLMQPVASVSKITSSSTIKKVEEAPKEVETVKSEAKVEETKSTTTEAKSPLESLSGSSRKMLSELLAMNSYKEVITYLDNKKEEGRMIYGRVKTMTSPEKSYLLITKNGQLVTILNKGMGERVNLKTNKPDPIKNYIGCGVIWFQIF